MTWQARSGMAGLGSVRRGEARRVTVWQARLGEAWLGKARRGKAGKVRRGTDWQGGAWIGEVWKMKHFVIDDEAREEARIRPDRADKYEAILARMEVTKDGREAGELLRDAEQR